MKIQSTIVSITTLLLFSLVACSESVIESQSDASHPFFSTNPSCNAYEEAGDEHNATIEYVYDNYEQDIDNYLDNDDYVGLETFLEDKAEEYYSTTFGITINLDISDLVTTTPTGFTLDVDRQDIIDGLGLTVHDEQVMDDFFDIIDNADLDTETGYTDFIVDVEDFECDVDADPLVSDQVVLQEFFSVTKSSAQLWYDKRDEVGLPGIPVIDAMNADNLAYTYYYNTTGDQNFASGGSAMISLIAWINAVMEEDDPNEE